MLRPITSSPTMTPGEDYEYHALRGCPDCEGRGWVIENPFAQYNRRTRVCPTCWDAKRYYDKHGKLPDDIAAALTHNVRSAPQQ